MSERDLFLAALQKDDPAERAAYLDQACAGDDTLRQRVEVLLRAYRDAGSFLEEPAVPAALTGAHVPDANEPSQSTESPGMRLGPYKLLQQLGEGGMGSVWMAEQLEPVKRRVALKVIKAGMDSRHVLARFEQERQALAMMDHPNIAKVLDAGTTERGRPYFVMELVKGIPFTKFCDQEHLTPKERLELFIPVCQAVQHAHQKGIIHRDLKPSNVLIALYDGKPVPKIIDFGVAKAVSQRLTDRTMFTEVGNLVGTLEYMAPEQAELNNLDIDTRADIYALGVLLYELLTGSPPFTGKQLRSVAFTEMMRMIREVEPSKPSTKLTSSAELPSIAAKRKLEPKRLTRMIHGDLDWIAMKCLEKERSRRYETANQLALEIERYLADQPVLAGPPGASYRVRKFLRRNKKPVLAAALMLLALVGGVIGTSWGLVRAEGALRAEAEQRQQAEQERDAKEKARAEAVANEARAQAAARAERQAKDAEAAQRKQAEAVAGLLESVFQDLSPYAEQKEGVDLIAQLVARLDLAAEKLDKEYSGEPLVRARLRHALGTTQLALGEAKKAEALFQAAIADRRTHLGAGHLDTLFSLRGLGNTYRVAGRTAEAIQLLEQVIEEFKKKLGPDHPSTLITMHRLAGLYRAAGRTAEAIQLAEQVGKLQSVKLGPDHPDTLQTLNTLAWSFQAVGRYAEAIQLLEQMKGLQTLKLGPDHPVTMHTMMNLASAYVATGRAVEAIPLMEQACRFQTKRLGPDHPDTLNRLRNLGSAYRAAGRTAEAITLLEQVRDLQTKKVGPDHPNTLYTLFKLGDIYRAVGRTAEAILLLEQVREQQTKKIGSDHPETLQTLSSLALAYRDVGRVAEAIGLFEQMREQRTRKLGPDHTSTLNAMHLLANLYLDVGRSAEAILLYERVRSQRTKKLGSDHPDTLLTRNNLANAFRREGRLTEALPLYQETFQVMKAKLGPDHTTTLLTMNGLGLTLVLQGKHADAEPILRECLQRRETKAPNEWTTFLSKSVLGACLLGQKKYAEAEPLLLQGYEGLVQREAKIVPAINKLYLTEALEWLIELYEAQGRQDEATEWRQKRKKTAPPKGK